MKKGVVTGDDYIAVMNHARANGYAIPAVNCTMSPIINSCLEVRVLCKLKNPAS